LFRYSVNARASVPRHCVIAFGPANEISGNDESASPAAAPQPGFDRVLPVDRRVEDRDRQTGEADARLVDPSGSQHDRVLHLSAGWNLFDESRFGVRQRQVGLRIGAASIRRRLAALAVREQDRGLLPWTQLDVDFAGDVLVVEPNRQPPSEIVVLQPGVRGIRQK
jgi:hypothetical protein